MKKGIRSRISQVKGPCSYLSLESQIRPAHFPAAGTYGASAPTSLIFVRESLRL